MISVRDRSADFTAAVERVALRAKDQYGLSAPIVYRTRNQQRTAFTQLAADIGRNIGDCSSKLERLAVLAGRKSVFDDPTAEIEELTHIIKDDIGVLNKQISELSTLRENGDSRRNTQVEAHSEKVVGTLKNKLMGATQSFKGVLQKRTENLKAQHDRRSQFSALSPLQVAPRTKVSGGGNDNAKSVFSSTNVSNVDGVPNPRSAVLNQRASHGLRYDATAGITAPNNSSFNNSGYDISGSSDMIEVSSAGVLQQSALIQRENGYLSSRANAVESIETTISELGTIFSQLATMVSSQGELVQTIDDNVDDSLHHVEEGQAQLLKHLDSISGNRMLIIKVFSILLLFGLFYLFFMV